MKFLVRILITIFSLYTSSFVLEQGAQINDLQDLSEVDQKTGRFNQNSTQIEDEDYIDQEIFSREAFQKRLPPMSKKEKVIWSFRMSDKNSFL